MIVADLKKDKIFLTGKFTYAIKKSLKEAGFVLSSTGDLYATYDIYIKAKHYLIPNLWESKALISFINGLVKPEAGVYESYFHTTPYVLYPFQKEFVYWFNDPLTSRRASLNACSAGLGKTAQTLAALFATGKDKSIIILCPKNAIGVWLDHLKLFKYELPVTKGWSIEKGCCILTYDSLPPLLSEASDKRALEDYYSELQKKFYIIADEFHLCKNDKTKRTKRFKHLFKMMCKKDGKCIALTATPILNRSTEFKTLLCNLDLFKLAFGNAAVFNDLFGGSYHPKFKYLVWDSNKRKPEEIKERVKNVLFIRKKEEVLEQLPTRIDTTIVLDLEKKKYIKLFDILEEKYKHTYDLVKDMDEVDFKSYMVIRQALSIEKYKQALETIEGFEEIGKSIVVFSDFKAPIEELGKRKGWKAITGDVSSANRTKYVDEFNKGNLNLAVTIGAGSTSLSCTGTDTALFIDLSVVPGLNYQARNRIDRISKFNKTLNYLYFVSDHPFEIRMQNLILEKERLVLDVY